MSNGISSASNSLAAELLLNKIMNGQVQTDSGKTVSAGSKVTSTALNLDAAQAAAYVPAVEEGVALAAANQSKITSARDALNSIVKSIQGTTDGAALGALGTELSAMIGSTGVVGKELTDAGTAQTVAIGLGGTPIAVNATSGNLAVTDLGTAATAVSGLDSTKTDDQIKTAVDNLVLAAEELFTNMIAEEAVLGQKIQTLTSRSVLLNDLAGTYSDAASKQVLQGSGNASDLLNNVLG